MVSLLLIPQIPFNNPDPSRHIDGKCQIHEKYHLNLRKTLTAMEEGGSADLYLCRSLNTFHLWLLRNQFAQQPMMMYLNILPFFSRSLRNNKLP
jgi:hypothetical protein